jgi:serine protease Do
LKRRLSTRTKRVLPLLLPLILLSACSRPPAASLPDFADLVERVSPSVVNISAIIPDDQASDEADAQDSLDAPAPDSGRGQGDTPGKGSPAVPDGGRNDTPHDGDHADTPQSLGSGFILSSDGYILTNQHVVADAREITVRLSDRRVLPAKVVGSDERSDLALLKIDASGLPAVKLGNVSKLRVGEWVVAIGSPFGFDYSVTAGIVSAKGRSLDTEQYVPFIQTDAAINPGNSGGPLFNLKGEVVGINSQIYSQTGGFMGVAFSVPIDVAARVVKQLKEHGKVVRGWLGVVVQEIDRAAALKLGLDKPEGALIAKVIANSPAEQAGLRSGDVILSYDGTTLASSRDLPALVGAGDPGHTATLEVLRDRRQVEMRVQIGTLDDNDESAEPESPPVDAAPPLGATVQGLTDAQRRAAKVVSGGVIVTELAPGALRDAGVQVGDVILSIASQDVTSPDRFAEVVSQLTPGLSVQVLVQRRGQPLFLQVQPPLPSRGHG